MGSATLGEFQIPERLCDDVKEGRGPSLTYPIMTVLPNPYGSRIHTYFTPWLSGGEKKRGGRGMQGEMNGNERAEPEILNVRYDICPHSLD